MDVRGLKRDVQRGAASIEQVLEVVLRLDRRVRRLEAENSRLRGRLAQYEPDAARESSARDEAEEGGRRIGVRRGIR